MKGYKLTQQGKGGEAIEYYRRALGVDAAVRDYILYYLGMELASSGRCSDAGEVYREILVRYPESRWAAAVERDLRGGDPCAPASPSEPQEKEEGCDAARNDPERADCLFRGRQYGEAKGLYRRLAEGEKVSSKALFYLTRLSQAASRSQDFETAIGANRSIRERYPRTAAAGEAHRKIAFLLQDSADFRGAIPVLEELVAAGRSQHERRLYKEKIAWCHYRIGEFRDAVGAFDDALGEGESQFSLYWKGRGMERLGRASEAKSLFKDLVEIYPETYYGLRARERLPKGQGWRRFGSDPWWTSSRRPVRWEKRRESVEASRELQRIFELTSLGLLQDAAVEVRRVRSRLHLPLPSDPKEIRRREGRFEFYVSVATSEDEDYRLPHAGFLFSQAGSKTKKRGVDPWLVLAMMRQESRFRETVVSPAGAIGLLQIMPATGKRLAREAGWQEYQPAWLYNPLNNIELAVRYVRGLFELLGEWYAVVASYNAGEHVVSEWLKQRKGLPEEEFIEEIPYQETRDYVKKVYTNWKAYRTIYGAGNQQ